MDINSFAALKKQKAKGQGKKEPGKQKPVSDFFKKGGEPLAVPTDDAVAAAKRKAADKGVAPISKMLKKGDVEKKAPSVVIVEGHSSSEPPVISVTPSQALVDEGGLPRESIQFSLLKGTAIVHGTVDPKEFLRGATPSLDKAALSRMDDEAIDNKILRSSLTTCIALGEQVRRLEEWRPRKAQEDEKLKKLIHDNADAVRQMAKLKEELRQAKAEAERATAEKVEAERATAEAAKKAVEEAEAAKAEAVANSRGDAVSAFIAKEWRAEDQSQWVASVVEASGDA
ncbi:unnamed protein product [Cuscuta europaea]|uniref:Uncharacterized protein n=1 Tax=Cuscuta europaea TaxID=41803 RepID=A0A9P0YFR3_CUSEU|nr:unnamed protein product [Cuscuta europaea]